MTGTFFIHLTHCALFFSWKQANEFLSPCCLWLGPSDSPSATESGGSDTATWGPRGPSSPLPPSALWVTLVSVVQYVSPESSLTQKTNAHASSKLPRRFLVLFDVALNRPPQLLFFKSKTMAPLGSLLCVAHGCS